MSILHYMIDHKDQINPENVFVAATTVGLCKVEYSKLDRQWKLSSFKAFIYLFIRGFHKTGATRRKKQ